MNRLAGAMVVHELLLELHLLHGLQMLEILLVLLLLCLHSSHAGLLSRSDGRKGCHVAGVRVESGGECVSGVVVEAPQRSLRSHTNHSPALPLTRGQASKQHSARR